MDSAGSLLEELSTIVRVAEVFSVHWSREETTRNYSRFYRGRLNPPYRRSIEIQKGSGPFLAAVVADPSPMYEERDTPVGVQVVNANLHDFKVRRRASLQHPWALHTSDTAHKASRELMLLFGRASATWALTASEPLPAPTPWRKDLVASTGWQSLGEMFGALESTVAHVDVDPGARGSEADSRRPICLLTDEPKEALSILGAVPWTGYHPTKGSLFSVTVRKRRVAVELWDVSGSHIDARWCARLLREFVRDSAGVRVPEERDALALEAYLSTVLNRGTGGAPPDLLAAFMDDNGYEYVVPADRRIPFDYRFVEGHAPAARAKLDSARWTVESTIGRGLMAPMRRAVLGIRERALSDDGNPSDLPSVSAPQFDPLVDRLDR